MSDIINKTRLAAIEFRMAIFWFLLFSVSSLCSAMTAALVGTDWATLDKQSKFMICIAVLGNWTGTIMAFISKQAGRIKQTGEIFPIGDTQFISRIPAPAPQPEPARIDYEALAKSSVQQSAAPPETKIS